MRMKAIAPPAITERQLQFIERVRQVRNVSYSSQVIRWAIDELMQSPGTVSDETGPYPQRMPTATVSDEQAAFVRDLASALGVSQSQVIRNALKALENGLYPQERVLLETSNQSQ